MAILALSFNEVKLNPIPQQQDCQIWLSSSELAKALGYKSIDSVTKIYNRNSDEFTQSMTQVIDSLSDGQIDRPKNSILKARIFSLRGCHLIAMFARTAVAKEFRKWVLDILDKEVGQPVLVLEPQPHPKRTTKDKRTALHEAIALLMTKSKYLHFKDCYKIIHQRFNVNHLDEIAEEQLPEAVQYVHSLLTGSSSQQSELEKAREMNTFALALHMKWVSAWWLCYSESLKMLNPLMAAKIHDNFADGGFCASLILGKDRSNEINQRIKQDLPYHLPISDRIRFFRNV